MVEVGAVGETSAGCCIGRMVMSNVREEKVKHPDRFAFYSKKKQQSSFAKR